MSAQGTQQGVFTVDNLLHLASQLGSEVRTLDTCLADGHAAAAVTRTETRHGFGGGPDGTAPVIIVTAGGTRSRASAARFDQQKVLAAIDGAG